MQCFAIRLSNMTCTVSGTLLYESGIRSYLSFDKGEDNDAFARIGVALSRNENSYAQLSQANPGY